MITRAITDNDPITVANSVHRNNFLSDNSRDNSFAPIALPAAIADSFG
jgi:hypothetical protein